MNETKTGRAGELLAAGMIEGFGCRAILCQQENFDMLIVRDGEFYRCEVKTASRPNHHRSHFRYSYSTCTGSKEKKPINPNHVDIICLVALDVRKCYFIRAKDHRAVRVNVSETRMLDNDEQTQLYEVLERIDGEKNGLE